MSNSQDPNLHSRRQRRLSLFLLLAIPLAFVWLAVAALDAAADSSDQRRPAVTVTVDNTGDSSQCDFVACSLRGAIIFANTSPGPDTIDFDLPAGSTITLTGKLPIITDTLTIDGSAVPGLTVKGGSRILEVDSGAVAAISDMTLTNGGGVANGGAILNQTGAQLTLSSVNFISNTATTQGGAIYNDAGTVIIQGGTFISNTSGNRAGAIYNISGTLTINNSSFISSTAASRGGAIYNDGLGVSVVTIDGSTFTANQTLGGNGGGAIYNEATVNVSDSLFEDNATSATSGGGGAIRNVVSSTLVVADSSFDGNTAYEAGGAIRNSGALTVTGSTFASNSVISTTRGGGAIYVSDLASLLVGNSTFSANSAGEGGAIRNSGAFSLTNSTFSENSASVSGGGIYNSSSGILDYSNTIVANSLGGGDCINSPGATLSSTRNLVEDNSCDPTFIGDPNLGPFQDNGGPTLTYALLPGSQAVNNGDNTICAASPINNVDQRGVTRPQATTCDIGAYEVVAVAGLSATNDSPTILGQPTNLTATVTAGESVTYAWDFGDGDSGSGANTSHTYAATGTYTAVVTATNAANSQSASTVVQVDELITGLAATNDGPTALGSATQLTATITTGSNISYAWDFGDGNSGSGANPSHTYGLTGTYTAVVTATNSLGQQTASTQVQVEEPITGLAATNDSPTALGLSTQLTATITTGSNVTYAWDFGDGSSGSGANPTHTYAATGTYTAVVTATNAVSQQTASTQVQVQAFIVGLAATNDGPTVLGQSTHLTATITAGNGAVTYEWDLGDGDTASGPNVTHTYAAAGTYTAVVTATSTLDQKTASTVVKVDSLITGLAATNNGPTILGNSTQLAATITGGSNVTYAWNFGDGTSGTGANPTHLYAAAGSYTAVVTATNSVDTKVASTVVKVDVPIAGLTASNDGPTVLGGNTQLTASITGGTNVTYSWNLGDGSTASGATVTHKYAAAGSYTAVVTATNSLGQKTAQTVVVVKEGKLLLYLPLTSK